jgi:hypothetical protein
MGGVFETYPDDFRFAGAKCNVGCKLVSFIPQQSVFPEKVKIRLVSFNSGN